MQRPGANNDKSKQQKKRNFQEALAEVIRLTENKKINKENAFDVQIED